MNEYVYAEKWVELAQRERDPFDRFVYCYFALNAIYNPFYERNERQAIKSLYRETFNTHPDFKIRMKQIELMSEFKYFIERRPIRNCRYNPQVNPNDRFDTSQEVRDLSDGSLFKSNVAMLMIIYQIRCNLFHGNKRYDSEVNHEIMENASKILLAYMHAFLENKVSAYN